MKRPYQITGVVFFLFSAFIAQQSLELRYYTSLGPGPGFFPFWLAVIMGVLAAFMFYHATFGQSDPMPDDFWASRSGYLKGLAVIVSIVWVVMALEDVGFRIVMAVFMIFLLATLGRLKGVVGWTTMVAVTAGASWGAFWMFNDMLKVPLPVGMFGF
jgi:putative tricarboxylic transport membrane protein